MLTALVLQKRGTHVKHIRRCYHVEMWCFTSRPADCGYMEVDFKGTTGADRTICALEMRMYLAESAKTEGHSSTRQGLAWTLFGKISKRHYFAVSGGWWQYPVERIQRRHWGRMEIQAEGPRHTRLVTASINNCQVKVNLWSPLRQMAEYISVIASSLLLVYAWEREQTVPRLFLA